MKESEKTEFKKNLAELGDGLNSIAAILNNSFINAFCHRDYRDPDEVRIAIFPDRVEVRNPGTLMEGVSLRTLRTPKVSRRRNPLIADLLRRIQYIEAWGRGIPLILEKAPNVRFSQVTGIFITEFPRPSFSEEEEPRPESGAQSGSEVTPEVTPEVTRMLGILKSEMGRREIMKALDLRDEIHFREHYQQAAMAAGLIEYTIPEKPNSRLQKYRLTPKGHAALSPARRSG